MKNNVTPTADVAMLTLSRLILVVGLLMALHSHAQSRTLTTKTFVITLTENCGGTAVVCDSVDYVGENRKTADWVKLRGKDFARNCLADLGDGPGKTPCQHLGSEFKNGPITYRLWAADGKLEVWQHEGTKRSRLLLKEEGKWDGNR
jgi:hypothetical protein